MLLTDVLKLTNQVESLNIIQTFLSEPLSYEDHMKAFSYYIEIANDNELDELVIEEGLKTLERFINQKPLSVHQNIYGRIIDSAIKINKFEIAKEFIVKRNEVLNIMDQYLIIIDEIKLNKALNKDVYNLLKQLLTETIPYDIKTDTLEELLAYYETNKDYQNALDIIKQLINFTNDKKYQTNELIVLYYLNEYEDVTKLATEVLKREPNNYIAATLLVVANIKLDKIAKAISLEAEYEDLIDTGTDPYKELAYNAIIEMYKASNNNKISVDHYQAKLKKLNKAKPKDTKNKEVEPKTLKPEVIKVEVIKEAPKSEGVLRHLKYHEWLNTWLIKSHKIDSKLALREYLRQLLIEVSKEVKFSEAILYIDKDLETNFFNYKKERLYDKKLIGQYTEKTIIKDVLDSNDIIFGKPRIFKNNIDIVTNKEYTSDIKFIYAFPLDKKSVVAFYLEEDLSDESKYFELFQGIASIIYTKLLDINTNERVLIDNKFYTDLIDKSLMPIRILTETRSTYNDSATNLFEIVYNEHLEIFLRDVGIHDQAMYNNTLKRLFNYPNEFKTIQYKYQQKVIIEHLYALRKNGKTHIISFFIDITAYTLKEKALTNEVIIDHETNLKNKYSLTTELKDFLKEKVTFVLIELNDSIKAVYGKPKINEFFIEFAKVTKEHFSDADVYRFEYNQVMVVLKYNDIRAVEKNLKEYMSVMQHYEPKVLKYEEYNYHMGVLRYPVATTEKDSSKLFRYLDIALNNAKRSTEPAFNHFIFKDYEDEVYEQQIIDYLNVAMENRQLSLFFKQIIDIEDNKIWQYESELIMPNINIDSKYLNIIAKKRNRIVELEHYHIEAVCIFLKRLEEETNRLIRLTIPISAETFLRSDFQGFLIGTLKSYEIPADFIRIITNLDTENQRNVLKIEEVINFGIALDTTKLNTALTHDFHALHLDLKNKNHKWLKYLDMLDNNLKANNIALVIRNINSKEDIDLIKNLGIRYIEGTVYKKLDSEKLLSKIKGQL